MLGWWSEWWSSPLLLCRTSGHLLRGCLEMELGLMRRGTVCWAAGGSGGFRAGCCWRRCFLVVHGLVSWRLADFASWTWRCLSTLGQAEAVTFRWRSLAVGRKDSWERSCSRSMSSGSETLRCCRSCSDLVEETLTYSSSCAGLPRCLGQHSVSVTETAGYSSSWNCYRRNLLEFGKVLCSFWYSCWCCLPGYLSLYPFQTIQVLHWLHLRCLPCQHCLIHRSYSPTASTDSYLRFQSTPFADVGSLAARTDYWGSVFASSSSCRQD